jgi:hypothetical protein
MPMSGIHDGVREGLRDNEPHSEAKRRRLAMVGQSENLLANEEYIWSREAKPRHPRQNIF